VPPVGQFKWYEIAVTPRITTKAHPQRRFLLAPLFYSLGIPVDLFTPVIAAGRIAGWTANIIEQYDDNRLTARAATARPVASRVRGGRQAVRRMPRASRRNSSTTTSWPASRSPARNRHRDRSGAADRHQRHDAWLQFRRFGARAHAHRELADHNVYQGRLRNSDDHRYMQTVSRVRRDSKPGSASPSGPYGASIPAAGLLGTDSHTPLCGAAGMLAIGAGGLTWLSRSGADRFFRCRRSCVFT
jgi:hypothetical protein